MRRALFIAAGWSCSSIHLHRWVRCTRQTVPCHEYLVRAFFEYANNRSMTPRRRARHFDDNSTIPNELVERHHTEDRSAVHGIAPVRTFPARTRRRGMRGGGPSRGFSLPRPEEPLSACALSGKLRSEPDLNKCRLRPLSPYQRPATYLLVCPTSVLWSRPYSYLCARFLLV